MGLKIAVWEKISENVRDFLTNTVTVHGFELSAAATVLWTLSWGGVKHFVRG